MVLNIFCALRGFCAKATAVCGHLPLLLYYFVFLSPRIGLAQEAPFQFPYPLKQRGIPFVQNYGPKTYSGHSQCWGITQVSDGTMYFGNGYGVLEYNGNYWKLIPLPSRTLVRSLDAGPDDIIYTGGVADLGFIARDAQGSSRFYSLKDSLPPANSDFSQIRYTVAHNREVFYLDFQQLMIWDTAKKKFSIIEPQTSFVSIMRVGGDIFVGDLTYGIQKYDNESRQLTPLAGTAVLGKERPKGMIAHGDGYLISTDADIYYYNTGSAKLSSFPLSHAPAHFNFASLLALPDGTFALKHADQGLFIYDRSGNLQLNLNEENGLANSSLHNVFTDQEGALWLTSNMGISRINLHMPFRLFDKRMGLTDIVNDVLRVNSKIFISTHSGTFVFDEKRPAFEFRPVFTPNLESFALERIGKWVMVSTNPGIYVIDTSTLVTKQIDDSFSYKFEQSVKDPSIILAGRGSEGRLILFDGNDKFVPVPYGTKFPYAIRFMEQDENGLYWVGTQDNKVVTLDIFNRGSLESPAIRVFDQKNGVPVSQISPRVVNGRVFLGSQSGIYEVKGDTVVKSSDFKAVDTMVPYIEYDAEGNIYLLSGFPPSMKIRKFQKTGEAYIEQQVPELSFIESNGLWISTPDFDGSYWISTTDGVLHYTPNQFRTGDKQLVTHLSTVSIGDSVVTAGIKPGIERLAEVPSFPFGKQTIRFEFSMPSYNNEDKTQFQYRLDGFDQGWSAWTNTHYKEYSGLSEGDYTFRVQSKNLLGEMGEEATYRFSITPPWYRSLWFLILSGLIFTGGGAFVVRYFSTKKLLRRVEELELQQKIQQERERISSDLHDHVGAQLTSIIAGLQITEQIEDFSHNSRVKEIIDSLKEDAGQTMESLRDSIWSLHHKEVSVSEFKDHIENYITARLRYFPSMQFTANVSGEKNLVLPPTLALNLLRVVQEACQNIFKHANATRITLTINIQENWLKLVVADNGRGFTLNGSYNGHYGLDNMSKRMEQMGGSLKIETKPEAGTALTFDVPVASGNVSKT